MPLVINSLKGRHTHAVTERERHTHIHASTHTNFMYKSNVKIPGA